MPKSLMLQQNESGLALLCGSKYLTYYQCADEYFSSRQEVRHHIPETESILTHQSGVMNRQHSHLIPHAHPHLSERSTGRAYHYDVNDDSLLLLQRKLQLENPNSTVFTAVLCPEPLEG